MLINLNKFNGADKFLEAVQMGIMEEFPKDFLIGVEMGIAYGGGVESLGIMWKERGLVFGFDTFSGHPKILAISEKHHEATCMDPQYKQFGEDKLSFEYQREELNKQGLDNVFLIRGMVTKESGEHLSKIHYCLLDMDMLQSMQSGYAAVENLIVLGGYLCLHDVVGHKLLPELHEWYEQMVKTDKKWEIILERKPEYLAILKRVV